MRLMPVISAALVLSTSQLSFAQEWIEFATRDDRFTCLFPSQPKITETTYLSPHEADLPAHVYSATQGQSRYSVTVVDYNQAQPILAEKAKKCPPGAEPCLGGPGDAGHWKDDVRGAIVYASWQFMQRDAEADVLRLEQRRHGRRTSAAAHQQRRQVPHVRRDLHAREQALYHRGNRAGGVPGAGLVSAIRSDGSTRTGSGCAISSSTSTRRSSSMECRHLRASTGRFNPVRVGLTPLARPPASRIRAADRTKPFLEV